MKNLFLILAMAAFFNLTACAQSMKNVPEKVLTAFSQKFPDASKVKWDKENDHEWEAEFKLNGKEFSANFNNDGNWMETEHEISENEIPAAVKATLNTEYEGYKIEESEISETASGTVYEFAIEKGKTEMEVAIGADGKVIKKEAKGENDEEDND